MPGVSIEFHPDLIASLHECSDRWPGLRKDLDYDFRRYIESDRNEYPNYFGRDKLYSQPVEASRAGLMHVHLGLPPLEFHPRNPLYHRTNPRDPELDAVLVYCQHELYEHRILLIELLYPGGHEKAQDRKIMHYLAQQARDFHERF
ncbi:type II toxin-antitoxin system YafO family toxin [Salinicola halophyticus]|uniref:type II toxin-antitoxin system YafO family toxin n=1 Tax=Salinicola halophyticus TaxID=1808881 RepID=UPI003F48066D